MSEIDPILKLARVVVQHFEGCHLQSYVFKGEKQATVGWGTAIPLSKHPITVTQEQADQWLDQGLSRRLFSVKALLPAAVWSVLTIPQKAMILSWAYNCKGWENSETFALMRRGNSTAFIEAADEWYRGETKQPLAGLVRRRAVERHIFERGSIEEIIKLDWYRDLVLIVNRRPAGHLKWGVGLVGPRLVWAAG